MQMTVNRLQLIDALNEKRAEVTAAPAAALEDLRAELAKASEGTEGGRFLRALADLVDSGDLEVVCNEFSRRGGGYLSVVRNADVEMPEAPKPSRGKAKRPEARLELAERKVQAAAAPYDAALRLLHMSDDEKVGIDAGDYHGLLGGKPARRDDDAVYDN